MGEGWLERLLQVRVRRPQAVAEASATSAARRTLPLHRCEGRGLVVGRNLLYPPDGDVAAAVDVTVSLMRSG